MVISVIVAVIEKMKTLTKYARLLEEVFWEKLVFEKKVDNGSNNGSNRENENFN